jgi:hypothetical protein
MISGMWRAWAAFFRTWVILWRDSCIHIGSPGLKPRALALETRPLRLRSGQALKGRSSTVPPAAAARAVVALGSAALTSPMLAWAILAAVM